MRNCAPGAASNDDRQLGRPIASPFLSLLRCISLFQSRSLRAADRLQGTLGLLLCAVMPSLLFHLLSPTGSVFVLKNRLKLNSGGDGNRTLVLSSGTSINSAFRDYGLHAATTHRNSIVWLF